MEGMEWMGDGSFGIMAWKCRTYPTPYRVDETREKIQEVREEEE